MATGPNLTARLPATKSLAVTPSDTDAISYDAGKVRTRGISCKVAGDIAYKDEEGNTFTAAGLAAGVIHPISCVQIMATNTTATDITVHW